MNLRPSGYEPDELPDCSTPHQEAVHCTSQLAARQIFVPLQPSKPDWLARPRRWPPRVQTVWGRSGRLPLIRSRSACGSIGLMRWTSRPAALRAIERPLTLHERLEDLRQQLRRDAQSIVAHPEHGLPTLSGQCNADDSAGPRVLDGIREDIGKDLLDPDRIAVNPVRSALDLVRSRARQRQEHV